MLSTLFQCQESNVRNFKTNLNSPVSICGPGWGSALVAINAVLKWDESVRLLPNTEPTHTMQSQA